MIGDSAWPFLHLNHLSPVVSPNNPSVHSTRAEDLTFPVDSADLSRQLEAWSNIKFAFDEDQQHIDPCQHVPLNVNTEAMAAQARYPVDMSKASCTSLDDPNPYSARRAIGTNPALSMGPTHPLFAHAHNHVFQPGPHLPFDFQDPVYGGQAIGKQAFSPSLSMSAFMGTNHSENIFSGLPLSYPLEPNSAVSADFPSFDGLEGLAELAELASATSRAPVEKVESAVAVPVLSDLAPVFKEVTVAHASNDVTLPVASNAVQPKAPSSGKKAGNATTPEEDDVSRLALEEDKRRRNTAASARFRIKKKLREQAVEKTAAELRERVNELEKEVDGLKRENGWLRGLIVDRATRDAKSVSVPGSASGSSASDSPPPSAPCSISAAKRPRRDEL